MGIIFCDSICTACWKRENFLTSLSNAGCLSNVNGFFEPSQYKSEVRLQK